MKGSQPALFLKSLPTRKSTVTLGSCMLRISERVPVKVLAVSCAMTFEPNLLGSNPTRVTAGRKSWMPSHLRNPSIPLRIVVGISSSYGSHICLPSMSAVSKKWSVKVDLNVGWILKSCMTVAPCTSGIVVLWYTPVAHQHHFSNIPSGMPCQKGKLDAGVIACCIVAGAALCKWAYSFKARVYSLKATT